MNFCMPRSCRSVLEKVRVSLLDCPHGWILGLGVLLRLKHYFEATPFWLDEAWVAVSITSRSYLEILKNFQVLPGFAHPPMLFVLIERACVDLFGNQEMSLRLFPLAAAIGALFVFHAWTKSAMSRQGAMIALALLAISEPAVYYAAQLKQYSTDMFLALAFLWMAQDLFKGPVSWGKVVLVAGLGACALWLSSPLVFVLIAIICVWAWDAATRRDLTGIFKLSSVGSIWLVSFILNYKICLSQAVGNQAIMGMWKGAFYTGDFFSWQMPLWLGKVFVESFRDPVGLPFVLCSAALFVVGVFSLWRRDVKASLLVVLPVALTLIAALVGKYPFRGRVILFLSPLLIMGVVEGVEYLSKRAGRWSMPVMIALCGVIFFYPVVQAGYYFGHGRTRVDNRKAMEFLKENYRPGDFFYMNTSGQPPFWYYAKSLGISAHFPKFADPVQPAKSVAVMKVGKFACHLIRGPQDNRAVVYRYEYNIYDEKDRFRADIVPRSAQEEAHIVVAGQKQEYPLSGRTWVFLSGDEPDDIVMNGIIRKSFDISASRTAFYEGKNAGVYLYELSR